MRKTLIFLTAALSFGAAANAEPARQQSFEHDGYTYVYEVKADAKGQVISGTRFPDKTPFTFTVKGNRIEGVSNGQPISFSLAEARGAAKGSVNQ